MNGETRMGICDLEREEPVRFTPRRQRPDGFSRPLSAFLRVDPRFVINPVKRAPIQLPACQPPVGAFSSVASLQPTLPMMYRATTNPILLVARAGMPAT